METLLIDTPAERGLIGTMLEDVQPGELDPSLITSDCLRCLFLTLDSLMRARLLYTPADYTNAGLCWRTAKANAELVAHQIDLAGIWPGADGPRWELANCMTEATLPWLSDFYVDRLKQAARRRWLMERAEELRKLALNPAPLDATTLTLAA